MATTTAFCGSMLAVTSIGKTSLGAVILGLRPSQIKATNSHLTLPAISAKISRSYSVSKEQVESGTKTLAAIAVEPNARVLQEIAETENNDSRGPMYNSQLNQMRVPKGLIGALGVSAAISGIITSSDANALQEITRIAEGDSRGLILLLTLVPALGWVLFNILQPALNQIDRMRQKK